jgi:hypothetical protein
MPTELNHKSLYKAWFDCDGDPESDSVLVEAENMDDAVTEARDHLVYAYPDSIWAFNYLQAPDGEFVKVDGEWKERKCP